MLVTLRSTDFSRTRRFYTGLFGWDLYDQSPAFLGFEPPSGISGGFLLADGADPRESAMLYVQVDSLEPYVHRTVELGGSTDGKTVEVPGYGRYTVLLDPDGNRVAVWQTLGPGEPA